MGLELQHRRSQRLQERRVFLLGADRVATLQGAQCADQPCECLDGRRLPLLRGKLQSAGVDEREVLWGGEPREAVNLERAELLQEIPEASDLERAQDLPFQVAEWLFRGFDRMDSHSEPTYALGFLRTATGPATAVVSGLEPGASYVWKFYQYNNHPIFKFAKVSARFVHLSHLAIRKLREDRRVESGWMGGDGGCFCTAEECGKKGRMSRLTT
eukprot:g31926.t1